MLPVGQSFKISKYEITELDLRSARFWPDQCNLPLSCLFIHDSPTKTTTYNDAIKVIEWLNATNPQQGEVWGIPTLSQWMLAAVGENQWPRKVGEGFWPRSEADVGPYGTIGHFLGTEWTQGGNTSPRISPIPDWAGRPFNSSNNTTSYISEPLQFAAEELQDDGTWRVNFDKGSSNGIRVVLNPVPEPFFAIWNAILSLIALRHASRRHFTPARGLAFGMSPTR